MSARIPIFIEVLFLISANLPQKYTIFLLALLSCMKIHALSCEDTILSRSLSRFLCFVYHPHIAKIFNNALKKIRGKNIFIPEGEFQVADVLIQKIIDSLSPPPFYKNP